MQRGLTGQCKGSRSITGGSAYTVRKRLRDGYHPTRFPLVPLGPSEAPTEGTRARFSRHFGVDQAGVQVGPAAPRVVPFSKQPVAPRLGLASVLLAFGFSNRAEAEELGRKVLADRAEAQTRQAAGADPEAGG